MSVIILGIFFLVTGAGSFTLGDCANIFGVITEYMVATHWECSLAPITPQTYGVMGVLLGLILIIIGCLRLDHQNNNGSKGGDII